MKGKKVASTRASSPILGIGQGKGNKRKGPPKENWKGKSQAGLSSNAPKGKSSSDAPPVSDPNEAIFFYYNNKGN